MHRFYIEDVSGSDEYIYIEGADVNHIKNVLRVKIGEEVVIGDGSGRDYYCRVAELNQDSVCCKIEDICDNASELPVEITLYQGMPKADKMEFIIQKAVELGASRIVPVMTKRTVVKLDPKKEKKKIERFNAISESAAKQSGRGIIPKVSDFMTFKDAINEASKLDMAIIPYENAEGISEARRIIASVKGKKNLGIFIGPEGGFASEEIELAMKSNVTPITLGNRILRTETAGMAVLSILMFSLEE